MPDCHPGKLLLAVVLVLALGLMAACAGEPATTAEPSPTAPLPTHSPTPQPTAQPTVTPAPSIIPVYKPREALPDGHLFPEGFFAVLKGEGAAYNVYDWSGQLAYTFTFIQTEGDVNQPVGLYTGDELWERGYRDTSPLNDPRIQTFRNGFFLISEQGSESSVDLYSRSGQHLLTLKNQCSVYEVTVSPYGSGTAVCFAPFGQKTTLILISGTGRIRKTILAEANTFALLAEKYLSYSFDETANLVDLKGQVIREKVTPIDDAGLYMRGQEISSFVLVGNYFSDGQTIYDARSLQPVADGTIDPDTGLIRGLNYYVDGIPCQAYQNNNRGEMIAVGYAGDRIAIQTRDKVYNFIAGEDRFYAMNQAMLILADELSQNFRILSLATGEEIAQIRGFHHMQFADEYLIVSMNHMQNGIPTGFYIIDKGGDIRCVSEKSRARASYGETIILQRGPYIGLADLNGDWLIKALDWEILRDAEFEME